MDNIDAAENAEWTRARERYGLEAIGNTADKPLIIFEYKGREHTVRLCRASSMAVYEVDGIRHDCHINFAVGADENTFFTNRNVIDLALDRIDPEHNALTGEELEAIGQALKQGIDLPVRKPRPRPKLLQVL